MIPEEQKVERKRATQHLSALCFRGKRARRLAPLGKEGCSKLPRLFCTNPVVHGKYLINEVEGTGNGGESRHKLILYSCSPATAFPKKLFSPKSRPLDLFRAAACDPWLADKHWSRTWLKRQPYFERAPGNGNITMGLLKEERTKMAKFLIHKLTNSQMPDFVAS